MMERMSARLLNEWLAFSELEPFGPLAEAYRAGVCAAAPYNTAFGRSKGAKVIKPEDFFPSLRKPAQKQTPAQLADQLRGATVAMGGTVRKKGEPEQKPVKARAVKVQPVKVRNVKPNRKGKGD